MESLIFGLLPFQVNSFRTLFSLLIISTRALVAREGCLILDIAEVLEKVHFPSTIKSCILHNFSTFFYFPNMSDKVFFLISSFLLQDKYIPKIFAFWFSQYNPYHKSAIHTPFRTPMPIIPHFALLGFKLERRKNLSKAFTSSIAKS